MLRTTALQLALLAPALTAQEPSMMRGIGWRTDAVFTIGTTLQGPSGQTYRPVGVPSGLGAFPHPSGVGTAIVTVQHQLNPASGRAFSLANGTVLTGARISKLEVVRNGDGSARAIDGGLAFDTVFDRAGLDVLDPAQVNETARGNEGLSRLGSGAAVEAGSFGFVDDLLLCGESTAFPFHPHGGSIWALEMATGTLHAVPDLGRGAWGDVTPIDSGDPQNVALLLCDSSAGGPLYLYVGTRQGTDFLGRNGLRDGQLFYWKADDGDSTPEQFQGVGSARPGSFVPLDVDDPTLAGNSKPGYAGHDLLGYRNGLVLRGEVAAAGGFRFSRPEGLSTNPANPDQAVLTSSGRSSLFPSDTWGTTYLIDVDAVNLTAVLTVLTDADREPVPDASLRNPDGVTWAADGQIYVQEDRVTSLFAETSGQGASIWEIDPVTQVKLRAGQINRSVLLPDGTTDEDAGRLGAWESSGVIEVGTLLGAEPGETLLLAGVQAHGLSDGAIGGNSDLDEGGQLFLMSSRGIDHAIQIFPIHGGAEIRFDVTNGTPSNGYGVVLAFQNPNRAPDGYFFGVDVAFPEFSFLVAPLVGMLDANGESSFALPLPGLSAPFGFTFDTVVVEVGSNGIPLTSGPAVTVRL